MEHWKESEKQAYLWFKITIDPDAILCGGEDSTVGDIYSPLYQGYIEVKDITTGARCGQFTQSTIINNPYAQAIYDGDYNSEICREFVKYHYKNKGISYFIIINDNDLSFYSFEDFFMNYTFEVQKPYEKRSGTSKAPKKDIPVLLSMDSSFSVYEDGRIYCNDSTRWGEYFSMTEPFDYFISKNNNGELRKRSTTKNLTWHLLIK